MMCGSKVACENYPDIGNGKRKNPGVTGVRVLESGFQGAGVDQGGHMLKTEIV
jgi:hypothetical protein